MDRHLRVSFNYSTDQIQRRKERKNVLLLRTTTAGLKSDVRQLPVTDRIFVLPADWRSDMYSITKRNGMAISGSAWERSRGEQRAKNIS